MIIIIIMINLSETSEKYPIKSHGTLLENIKGWEYNILLIIDVICHLYNRRNILEIC